MAWKYQLPKSFRDFWREDVARLRRRPCGTDPLSQRLLRLLRGVCMRRRQRQQQCGKWK